MKKEDQDLFCMNHIGKKLAFQLYYGEGVVNKP
jgi:hypothetical protein